MFHLFQNIGDVQRPNMVRVIYLFVYQTFYKSIILLPINPRLNKIHPLIPMPSHYLKKLARPFLCHSFYPFFQSTHLSSIQEVSIHHRFGHTFQFSDLNLILPFCCLYCVKGSLLHAYCICRKVCVLLCIYFFYSANVFLLTLD